MTLSISMPPSLISLAPACGIDNRDAHPVSYHAAAGISHDSLFHPDPLTAPDDP
jgi:hypothetical protein